MLICPVLWILLRSSSLFDTTIDVCYAVDVCNWLTSLPIAIEHASMVESGIEQISVTLADNHSTKSMVLILML